MFRRIEATLPADPTYPADLSALGYFVNNTGHVRKLAHPEESFLFSYTNDARHNEVHREAMQECQRQEVLTRLAKIGIAPLYLDQSGSHATKPSGPHIPILCPPLDVLKTRKHVILIINDSLQDLGILAYRQLQRELGLNGGSVVNFAKEIVKRGKPDAETADLFNDKAGVADIAKDAPGLIVANTGQRYYSHKHNQAMTLRSWSAMPRKSVCHDEPKIDEVENTVPGHRDAKEHIKTIFKEIINNENVVSDHAAIYVIGIENGGQHLLEILDREDWFHYRRRIQALALIQTGCDSEMFSNVRLKEFLRQRAREWKVDSMDEPNICIEDPLVNTERTKEDAPSIPPDVPSGLERKLHWLGRVFESSRIGYVSALKPEPPKETIIRKSGDTGPLCPAFSGGPTGTGECIFTNPAVYKSILDFFQEVYEHDYYPVRYANPKFDVHVPLSEEEFERKEMLPPDMAVEQQMIEEKKAEIEHMKQSLEMTPKTDMFEQGRANLERRIQRFETELDNMIKAEDAANDLSGRQIEGPKSDWEPVGQGPRTRIAGTMVEVDLLKGAGLLEVA